MKQNAKMVPFHYKVVKGEDGKTKYFGIASSDALDRDREILIPKGMKTENFQKNPVMLLGHNYYGLPIGKVNSISPEDSEVKFEFDFAETDEAKTVKELYDGGYMNAFSVSFIPTKYMEVTEETPDQLTIPVSGGGSYDLDLTKYAKRPRGIIAEWELLEVSAVSVPANPDAVLQRSFDMASQSITDPAKREVFKSQIAPMIKNMSQQFEDIMKTLEDKTIKGAISVHQTPIVDDDWDANAAKSNLAVFASEDGSGSKDTLDWGSYSRGFAWFDESKVGMLTGYKYLHHDIIDGKLVANWNGLKASMLSLLKNEEQPDREQVYLHLAKHFEDYDQEPPELKSYTDEELEKVLDNSGDLGNNKDNSTMDENVSELVKILTERLEEMEQSITCRINILSGTLVELMTDMSGKNNSVSSSDDDDDDNGDTDFGKELDEMTSLFKTIVSGYGE